MASEQRLDKLLAGLLTIVRPFSSLGRTMQGLTQRQQMVLDFIRSSIVDRGYPPTLREIGARMGIRSTNGVNDHLRALERKGYLTREDMKSRALRPMTPGEGGSAPRRDAAVGPAPSARTETNGHHTAYHGGDFADARPANDDDLVDVPILGRVAAGQPLLAEEMVID